MYPNNGSSANKCNLPENIFAGNQSPPNDVHRKSDFAEPNYTLK